MKRMLAVLFAIMMILSLCACDNTDNPAVDGTNKPDSDSTVIEWGTLPDNTVIGAWLPQEPVGDEYVLFTPEGKIRIAYGTVVFEADIKFGADGMGNKSAYTLCNYLYGQWTYTVKDDVLTVTYPEGDVKKFDYAPDFKPINLQAKEGFTADSALVGDWSNNEYGDKYSFTEDGFVTFTQHFDDDVYAYDTEILYSYTVDNSEITLYYYEDFSGEEKSYTFGYSIDGDKLLLDGNDYYRGGAPETEAASE